jgi:hypothetical protein
MTLNLLLTTRQHQQLSSAAHFHGMVDYNKTSFATPGCKIIEHKRTTKRQTWAPHGQHDYSLGPSMHHYRCQNVYISTTAIERIVDTLEFPPRNSPMPQFSSADRLIMAANETTNALKNHHPDVPFVHIRDDTISALTQLPEIFKNKFQKLKSLNLSPSPIKAAENKRPPDLLQPILSSPNNINIRRGHTHAITSEGDHTNEDSGCISEGAHSLTKSFPQKFSKDDFWSTNTTNVSIALGTNHWSK